MATLIVNLNDDGDETSQCYANDSRANIVQDAREMIFYSQL